MNSVGAKIYYLKSTGEVLVRTGEIDNIATPPTVEQDLAFYPELKSKTLDEIDFIELPYGTLGSTFNNAKSYKINLETKQLEITYYTEEELLNKKNQKEQQINLNDRINLISKYSFLDNSSISDLEKYILQREKDRIIGGVK